jgi:hypothetical protein
MSTHTKEYWAEYNKRPYVRAARNLASKKWRLAHPEKNRAIYQKSNRDRVGTPEKIQARNAEKKKWWADHPEYRKKVADRRFSMRLYVINRYGGKCTCCGEEEQAFLCLDHIHNDGASHRRSLRKKAHTGVDMYSWAFRNDCPDTLQLLCYNCNCAKAHAGRCPHEDETYADRLGIG